MHAISTIGATGSVTDLVRAGLLEIGDGCQIHPTAVFLPADLLGTLRPIVLGARVTIGAFAVVHGGTRVGADARLGHRVIVGEPVRSSTRVSGSEMAAPSATTLLRTNVVVGSGCQLTANLTVERGARIGSATGSGAHRAYI